jgi:hypothetical protein
VEPPAELSRQIIRLPILIEADSSANIVDYDLARIASGHVFLELFAYGRIHRPVHIFVQQH